MGLRALCARAGPVRSCGPSARATETSLQSEWASVGHRGVTVVPAFTAMSGRRGCESAHESWEGVVATTLGATGASARRAAKGRTGVAVDRHDRDFEIFIRAAGCDDFEVVFLMTVQGHAVRHAALKHVGIRRRGLRAHRRQE